MQLDKVNSTGHELFIDMCSDAEARMTWKWWNGEEEEETVSLLNIMNTEFAANWRKPQTSQNMSAKRGISGAFALLLYPDFKFVNVFKQNAINMSIFNVPFRTAHNKLRFLRLMYNRF